jgi:hypothetical protein
MKKGKNNSKYIYFLTAMLFVAFLNVSYAQNRFSLGVTAGGTLSNINGFSPLSKVPNGTILRVGPIGGIMGEYKLSEKFFLGATIQYIQMGAINKAPNIIIPNPYPNKSYMAFVDLDINNTFDYLMVPVQLSYNFKSIDKWHLYATAGGYGAYLLGSSSKVKGISQVYADASFQRQLSTSPQNFDLSMPNFFSNKHFDFGIMAGAGVSMKTKQGKVFGAFTGYYGITNFVEKNMFSLEYHHYGGCVRVGYLHTFM